MIDFEVILQRIGNSKKHIIATYKLLITPTSNNILTYQKKWKHRLQIPIDDEVWQKI